MSDDPWAAFNPEPLQQPPQQPPADQWAAFAPADKYQQAAIDERQRLLRSGAALPEGFTRRLASGPFLGWADTLTAGAMTPFEMARQGTFNPAEGYRYAKAREDLATQTAKENTGIGGDVAETVGALATLPGNIFGKQAAAALGGGGTGILPAAGRMAGYGLESGALGAVQGAGNAPTVGDIPSAALKGGVLGGAFGAPFGAFANVAQRTTAAVPTAEELTTLGARAYRARDQLPVRYDTGYVGDRLSDLQQANWNKYGRDAPETIKALGERAEQAAADVARAKALNASAAPPGSVAALGQTGAPNSWQAVTRPRDIASLRREIYEAGGAGSGTDERAGTIASKIVDRILTRPDPASLAQGSMRDALEAAQLHTSGRGNFAAAYRSKAVTDAVEKSLADAAAQHSGLNFENILRQNLKSAQRKEQFGSLSAEEQANLEQQLIRGTTRANTIRELGNMLGGGGGLGRAVAMGGLGTGGGAIGAYMYGGDPVAGGLGGLAMGTAGRALRTYGNTAAERAANAFAEQLRQRSPEYLSRVARAPTEIGPGLSSSMGGLRTALTLGGGGNVRDAIAAALQYNLTGQRPQER